MLDGAVEHRAPVVCPTPLSCLLDQRDDHVSGADDPALPDVDQLVHERRGGPRSPDALSARAHDSGVGAQVDQAGQRERPPVGHRGHVSPTDHHVGRVDGVAEERAEVVADLGGRVEGWGSQSQGLETPVHGASGGADQVSQRIRRPGDGGPHPASNAGPRHPAGQQFVLARHLFVCEESAQSLDQPPWGGGWRRAGHRESSRKQVGPGSSRIRGHFYCLDTVCARGDLNPHVR